MTTKERIDEKRKHLRTGRAVLTALTTLAAVLALSLSGCAGTSGGSSAGKAQETATETSGESVSNKNASGKSVSTEGISTENRSGEEGSPAAAASEGASAAEVAAEVSSSDASRGEASAAAASLEDGENAATAETGAAAAEMGTPTENVSSAGLPAPGNYIDDAGNHLSLYHLTVEDGYDRDSWSATVLFGEEIWSATELSEENGTMTGDLAEYKSDESEGGQMHVTITKEDNTLVLRSDAGKTYTFAPDDTDYAAMAGDAMPFFQYNQLYSYRGFDNLYAAVYDYLSFDKETQADPAHALIPYAKIVAVDQEDPEDVRIYGDYWLMEYEKQGDVLVAVSGGHCPGIIHAERFGDVDNAVYSATGMDEALTDDEAVTLFGDHYEEYERIASDDKAREEGMAQVIADYVSANDLDITAFSLGGDETVPLPESHAGKPHEKVDLPAWTAADPASEEAAVYSCLIDTCAESLGADEYDVTIPYAVILGKDESDPEDIRVLLTGSVECWNLEEGVLEAGASAEVTGAVHLKKTGDGYEATSFENVWDGEDYEKTAKQIFGDHYDAFTKLDSKTKEAARKQAIKDYVTRNDLDITAYKDFDADPVDL